MNNKDLKKTLIRLFKFMLIGIIPNLFLYYFCYGKMQEWLISFISILIFITCAFIGEVIYVSIRNRQQMQQLVEDAEKQELLKEKQQQHTENQKQNKGGNK